MGLIDFFFGLVGFLACVAFRLVRAAVLIPVAIVVAIWTFIGNVIFVHRAKARHARNRSSTH